MSSAIFAISFYFRKPKKIRVVNDLSELRVNLVILKVFG